MRHFTMLIVVLACLYAHMAKAGSVSGRVTSKEGEPLAGANIILEGTYLGTMTGTDGEFGFENLKKGTYTLKVSFLGYVDQTKQVTIKGPSDHHEVDMTLRKKSFMTDEVIVRSTKASSKVPVAVSNIGKEELKEKNQGKDLPYLIRMSPSVVTSSDAGTGIGYTYLRIRGTDQNRINVTIDGIPYNDAESHGVFWVDLPDIASSLENIQIQRGVGSSTNGAAAFGATINLETNRMQKDPYGEINTSLGSFNTQKASLNLGSGLIHDHFSFHARLSKIKSDGFIDRAWADLSSWFVSGGYYDNKNLLKINIFSGFEETYQAWGGVPKAALDTNRTYNPYTYENEIDHYRQTHYHLHYSRELTESLTFNTALHYTRGKGYFEQYQNDDNYYHQTSFAHYGLENLKISDTVITNTDLVRRLWLDNDFYGFIFSFQQQMQKINLTLGGGWNKYDGDHFGHVIWARYAGDSEIRHQWYDNTGIKTDFNIYGKVNYRMSNDINLYADLQYRQIHFKTNGDENGLDDIALSRDFNFLNPKLGLFYTINNNHETYTSLSVANREPNRDNFVDAKAAGLEMPVHETLLDYEFGHTYTTRNLALNTNFYYMRYYNQLVMTGEINYVGMPILTNVPNSYRTGVEISLRLKPFEKLTWNMNTTLSKNKIMNFEEKIELYNNPDWWTFIGHDEKELGETDLSFSPEIIAGSQLSYTILNGLSVHLLSKYVGKQYIDNTSNEERTIDPYFVNNIRLDYSLKPGIFKELMFQLQVNNILDEEYETNAWVYRARFEEGVEYTDYGYYPQAGMNYLASLILKF